MRIVLTDEGINLRGCGGVREGRRTGGRKGIDEMNAQTQGESTTAQRRRAGGVDLVAPAVV